MANSTRTAIGDTPAAAVAALINLTRQATTEPISLADAAGRVLATAVRADRASPACDVSAMDGYAVPPGLIDGDTLRPGRYAVTFAVETGREARPLESIHSQPVVARVFTGGMVPSGAVAVVPRERVAEDGPRPDAPAGSIGVPAGVGVLIGQHVRRRGENAAEGAVVSPAGRVVTPAVASASAMFGRATLDVYRRVRVSVVVTGDELRGTPEPVEPWQLRDGNGPAAAAFFDRIPYAEASPPVRVPDDPARIRSRVQEALTTSDLIVLTGGVSMGDFDHVPEVLRWVGVRTVFHRLPLRPGKPILAGVTNDGRAVFGLPGNPVSTLIGLRRMVYPVLRHVAGIQAPERPIPVKVVGDVGTPIPMWFYRIVRLLNDGTAGLIPTRGSGDGVACAVSDGFVEVPPGVAATGVFRFYPWQVPD